MSKASFKSKVVFGLDTDENALIRQFPKTVQSIIDQIVGERVEFYNKYAYDGSEKLKEQPDAWKEWCKTRRIEEAFQDWLFNYCFSAFQIKKHKEEDLVKGTPVRRYCKNCKKETNQVHAEAKDMNSYLCLECKQSEKAHTCWDCGGELVENYDGIMGEYCKETNVKHYKCKNCGKGHYDI